VRRGLSDMRTCGVSASDYVRRVSPAARADPAIVRTYAPTASKRFLRVHDDDLAMWRDLATAHGVSVSDMRRWVHGGDDAAGLGDEAARRDSRCETCRGSRAARVRGARNALDSALLCAKHSLHVIEVWTVVDGECTCPSSSTTRKDQPGGCCKSPGKHPVLPEWQRLASVDVRRLTAWFKNANRNVGMCAARLTLSPSTSIRATRATTFAALELELGPAAGDGYERHWRRGRALPIQATTWRSRRITRTRRRSAARRKTSRRRAQPSSERKPVSVENRLRARRDRDHPRCEHDHRWGSATWRVRSTRRGVDGKRRLPDRIVDAAGGICSSLPMRLAKSASNQSHTRPIHLPANGRCA
jgi:hypothetical protein